MQGWEISSTTTGASDDHGNQVIWRMTIEKRSLRRSTSEDLEVDPWINKP
jgi:hypothetical protein